MKKKRMYDQNSTLMMKYRLEAYSIWEQGPREKQEDSIYPKYGEITDKDRLFILCDGMGGHPAGEVASGTVCSAMSRYIVSKFPNADSDFCDEDFQEALSEAYDALDQKDNGAEKKMGTTLAFLKFHREGCTIAHIGDSRVYQIRPGKNAEETEIVFQTEDHSKINFLIKSGNLTPEEAKCSKQKNVIMRAMLSCMEHRAKADIYHSSDIRPGDYFMLCSDGILEQMEEENLKYIFSDKGGDIRNKIDILIKVTAENHDNHSAIVVHVLDVDTTTSFPVGSGTVGIDTIKPDRLESNRVVNKRKHGARRRNILLMGFILACILLGGYFAFKMRSLTAPDPYIAPEQVAVPTEDPLPVAPKAEPLSRPSSGRPNTNKTPSTSANSPGVPIQESVDSVEQNVQSERPAVDSLPRIQIKSVINTRDIPRSDEQVINESAKKQLRQDTIPSLRSPGSK